MRTGTHRGRSRLAAAVLVLASACNRGAPATQSGSSAQSASAHSASAPPRPVVAMPPTSEIAPLAKGNNAFTFALYDKIRSAPGNQAISPASISSAVAMAYGGARGRTADEIRKALRFEGDPAAVMIGWGKLQRALSSPDRPLVLTIANRLFGDRRCAFEKPFLDQTRTAFDAELELLDFASAPEPARVHINDWVAKQTADRIQDLIPAGAIENDTSLVLANAIYFLAKWDAPFHKQATADEDFTLASGAKKKTRMMHQQRAFLYAKVDHAAVLELPYKDDVASMLVFLPDKLDGLAEVERSLVAGKLDAWRSTLAARPVAVTLPRFEIKPPVLSLSGSLESLGMPSAFDPKAADFTAIAVFPDPQKRMYVKEAFHKAFVKVDEEGTEAAAATALVMGGGGGRPASEPIAFVADHPFVFAIVDRVTGLILFVGRLAEP